MNSSAGFSDYQNSSLPWHIPEGAELIAWPKGQSLACSVPGHQLEWRGFPSPGPLSPEQNLFLIPRQTPARGETQKALLVERWPWSQGGAQEVDGACGGRSSTFSTAEAPRSDPPAHSSQPGVTPPPPYRLFPVVAARGVSSRSSWPPEHRLCSFGTRA